MSRAARAIVTAGLLAGVLDLTDALVFFTLRGAQPVRILQSIASGLLGPEAFKGGMATAALGFALHFVIAFGAAATYYLASRKIGLMLRRPVLSGVLFGILSYAFMNLVVLPLSAVRTSGMTWPVLVNGILAHVFCVGLPIALMVRRQLSLTR